MVNHCGGPSAVAEFIRRSRAIGCTSAMIACVPLVCDLGSAAQLSAFGGPGTHTSEYARILTAAHPRRAGIDAAVQVGSQMIDTGLVAGINLSGGPADGEELAYAHALAEVVQELRR